MKKTLIFIACCLLTVSIAEAGKQWKAKWINGETVQSQTNLWLCFKKKVALEKVPQELFADIAADSKYWMWINDSLVIYEGAVKRGPTPRDTYYDEVNIAPYLKPGENTISILLWYFGKNGFSHNSSGTAALLFDCQDPENGISILSDQSWQCGIHNAYRNTEEPHPNFRLPESNIRFDARNDYPDWYRSSSAQNFPRAQIVCDAGDAPFNRLVKRPIPQWKNYGIREYEQVRQSNDTIYCQLPYNGHVNPILNVKAPAGKTIHILTDDYYGGSTPNVRAEYITREGTQKYENLGWMNGHQVLYIVPEGVEVLGVAYRETGYNTEFAGSFRCNDEFLNRLWQKAARTLYVTMRDTYMDCPDRERSQWWGDEVNELGETFYALDPNAHKLAEKGIYELMGWQRSDGTIFSPVPAGNYRNELPLQMLASVGYYGFYTQAFFSGNDSFVPVIYDRLHRYLHEVWQTDADGLPLKRDGGWSWGDWGDNIDMGVLTTCWYYLALKAEKEFALQLKNGDAETIAAMMERIENNFDKRYWTGTAYRSPDYTQQTDDRAQAMAIVSGLAGSDKYPALFEVLKKEYHASPYMEKYVLEALIRMDQTDYAIERMKTRYKDMVESTRYTTLWEGWGVGPQGFGGGTSNHAWSGGPLTLMSQYLCGIEPTQPGFKTFKIEPRMGPLTQITAKVASASGEIEADLEKKGSTLTLRLSVPKGTTADVVLPQDYRIRSVKGLRHNVSGNRVTLHEGKYTVKAKTNR